MNSILIVTESPSSKKSVREALKKGGYSFFDAKRGREALSILGCEKIDLVIADSALPDLSIGEMIGRIRENASHKNIPVIIVSTQNDPRKNQQALEHGAQDYIVMPPSADRAARTHLFLKARNLISMKNAIDVLEESLKNAERLTILDDVTGLFNYRYFTERLFEEFARSKRYHRPLSLVMIDLDNLKPINDEYGHQAGTSIISMVGTIIEKQCRSADIAVRYGGDEFCIIVPEANLEEAVVLAERLRIQIEKFGLGVDFGGKVVTASLGVTTQNETSIFEAKEAFLKAADDACYAAKKIGKNKVCWYLDGTIVSSAGVVKVAAMARRGIKKGPKKAPAGQRRSR